MHAAFLNVRNAILGRSMTYKITVKIIEKNLSTEAIRQAVNYISGALDSMQIAHTIECHHDKIVLAKMTKPQTLLSTRKTNLS